MADAVLTDEAANASPIRATGMDAAGPAGPDAQIAATGLDPEGPINELLFALYADDVRLGIVRAADITDASGALNAVGGAKYRRRAIAILRSLSRVPDAQIVRACKAEDAGTPRGAAARVELLRRGLQGA